MGKMAELNDPDAALMKRVTQGDQRAFRGIGRKV